VYMQICRRAEMDVVTGVSLSPQAVNPNPGLYSRPIRLRLRRN